MDTKSLSTLELPKVLERLANYTAFSGGRDLAYRLAPTSDLGEARRLQQETTEARLLLAAKSAATVGGARDVRTYVANATRGAVLFPPEILDIKSTLIAGRALKRTLLRLEAQFPSLASVAHGIVEIPGLVDAISRTLDERGEVLDSASERLATIRQDLRVAHDRLLDKLQAIISSPRNAQFLQEPFITQRGERYVIPLKASFKGRIRGIVHDQSASGATLFIEPLATVDLNNRWRELQLAEQEEIRRILTALSADVGDHAEAITCTVEALAELDLAFAKAKYAESLGASEPVFVDWPKRPAESTTSRRHPGSAIRLRQARHPLLDPETVVPIDVVLDDQTYVVVITGPNTGGKTVSLKTVGLLALMAQCGLHIPAQSGSELSVFVGVYADIGDEQSIEQSLSTFSSHITNIIRLLAQAGDRSLIVLDELGAGTDPGEGSALARALLAYLLDRSVTTFTATHYPELKAYAHATDGMINASVEFDPDTLAPTYRLVVGLPGRSNALTIASRLGLADSIVAEARAITGTTDQQVDDLLAEIYRQHEVARKERNLAEAVRIDVLALEAELTRRLEHIDDERRGVLAQAQAEAAQELDDLRTEIRALRRRLSAAGLPLTALKEIEAETEEFAAEVDAPPPPAPALRARTDSAEARPLRLGDKVWVERLGTAGVITTLTTEQAEVQIGRMRLRAQLDELRLQSELPADLSPEVEPAEPRRVSLPESPGMELDIRGQRVAEGLEALERYLDAAALAGLPWARIIHGKGSGRLREAIRRALQGHTLVNSFEPGKQGEGGDGVTVVQLVSLE